MSWSDTEKSKLRRENAQLRAELEAARKLYDSHCGYLDEAKQKIADAAIAHSIASSAESKLTRMTPPDWRDQDLRVSMIHACHLLMNAEAQANKALYKAIAEYRGLTEPPLSPGKRAVLNAALEKLDEMEERA
jgi:hypothetical protein